MIMTVSKPVDTEEDFSSKIVNLVMDSPLYTPIVGMARNTMVKTAKEAGLNWDEKKEEIKAAADWESRVELVKEENPGLELPEYYVQKFHGYAAGNLCINAALEQEIAGKAVGARNFPDSGLNGEEVLRGSYDRELLALGGISSSMLNDAVVVDMGCGTGTSTRRLAKIFPTAKKVIGYDLSPYMVAVGRFLSFEVDDYKNKIDWVEEIEKDDRISLQYGDMTDTGLENDSVSFVSVCLVMHELTLDATSSLLREASRILKPGGTVAIMEMDPDAPGYVKLRNTPWLFSILRSTEPHLDDYFNRVAGQLPALLSRHGFPSVKMSAATGRHFCLVANKQGVYDGRPSDEERELSDAHLNTMKSR